MKTKGFALLLVLFLSASCFAQIQVDSIKTTVSTCSNNGSITLFAKTGAGSLLYAITNGPATFPVQTNNVFSSLPPGNYTIEVSNTANQKQTVTAVITGNYELPDFTPAITDPDCPTNNTGIIIGTPTFGTGLSPYTWELIAPSEITRPVQSKDTFNNLLQGTYTLRMTDACNNIQTKSVILFTPPVTMTFSSGNPTVIGCDTTRIDLFFQVSAFRPPYKVSYDAAGVHYSIDTATLANGSGYMVAIVSIIAPNVTYEGAVTNITVTDHCGTQVFVPRVDVCPFRFWETYTPLATGNCKNGLLTSFGLGDQYSCGNISPKLPFSFTITDVATGNIVQTKTLSKPEDGTFTSGLMESGKTYSVTIKDGCNRTYTDAVTTLSQIRYIDHSFNGQVMLDSTVNYYIYAHGYPTQGTILTILDGPVSAHSSKKGYVYSEDYVYPKTFIGQVSSDSSMVYSFDNTAPGLYHFSIIDSCGNVYLDSFTVTSSDITSYNYQYAYKKGCAGESGIQYQFSYNALDGGGNVFSITDIKHHSIVYTKYGTNAFAYSGVVNNLKATDFGMEIFYRGLGKDASMNNILVDTFLSRDTIHIIPYQNPALQSSSSTTCNGHLFLTLTADSSKGVPPYQYEIISGPQTFAPQSSNYFELAQTGIYRIRVYDSCNNSSTADVSVGTITFPPLTKIGSSCINGNAQLTYGASPYFSYTWASPNGSSFSGDTLFITPVTKTDTGIYTITRVTNINGCINTDKTTYRLGLGTTDSFAVSICNKQTFLFGNKPLNQTGIYRDTIITASCDSIAILNLTVDDYKTDSNEAAVCKGQTYIFRNKALTQPGSYSDTVRTNTCDSIYVLTLSLTPPTEYNIPLIAKTICAGDTAFSSTRYYQSGIYADTIAIPGFCDILIIPLDITVSDYIKDSIVKAICAGQNFIFNNKPYTQTGIYRDTFATATCDSISILNLTVNDYKKDSIVKAICAGQNFIFNNKPYTQTGIYRDTIATATCDSIAILNLTVSNYKKDSIVKAICAGQSFIFNNKPYIQTGIYRDTIATPTCDSIAILNLTVSNYKKDSIVQSICTGQAFTFNNRSYTQTGIYRDTLTTATCDSIAILNLTVSSYKKDFVVQSICAGQAFTFNNKPYTQAGVYRDTLSALPCDSIAILNLTILPPATAAIIASSFKVDKNDTVQLNVIPAARSYLWSATNALLSNKVIQNPFATIPASSWIYVETTSTIGSCVATDSVFIVVDDSIPCNHSYIYLPNAFTPNADGLNDLFRIQFKNISLAEFQVFNRWGERVFRTNNIKDAWDGKYKGEITAGNYVYLVSYHWSCDNNVKLLKGNVVLIQ